VPVPLSACAAFSYYTNAKKQANIYRLGMKANTFPFNDGGNAAILAAARKESFKGTLNRGSSFRSGDSFHRTTGPVLRDKRVKASNPLAGLGSVQTQKLPRNLPKLDARNMPSLPQLGQIRRIPGGMAVTNNAGIMKPRKLAPIGSTADKGKQLLNAALEGGSLKKKKKHRKKGKKRKRKKRPPGSNLDQIAAENDMKDLAGDPIEEAAAQAHMHLCELLDTKKGRGILMQEAKISKAFREGNLVDLHFERNPNQSLGIAFNIPARVSAMNWVSQQRLIVCNIKKGCPAEVAEMQVDDIVARIDDHDCQSIEGFKEDINGKSNFTITVARCKGVNVEDIRKVRKDIEFQVMETARQRAREMQTKEEV